MGTHKIALLAHRMGITTPLSTNPAMTIGGLTVGVTPLDMAHAYETIAHGGQRVSGTHGRTAAHPSASRKSTPAGHTLPDGLAATATACETQPRAAGGRRRRPRPRCSKPCCSTAPARAAAIGQFAAGKTGTTSNYGDAWFVGWDSKYTVAVWVGYPDKLVPMTTDFNGSPVLGGTFPALIWHDFMTSALQIDKTRAEQAPRPSTARRHRSASTTGARESSAPSATTRTPGRRAARAGGKRRHARRSSPAGAGNGEPAAAGSRRRPRTRRGALHPGAGARSAGARARRPPRPPTRRRPHRPRRPAASSPGG